MVPTAPRCQAISLPRLTASVLGPVAKYAGAAAAEEKPANRSAPATAAPAPSPARLRVYNHARARTSTESEIVHAPHSLCENVETQLRSKHWDK